MTQSNVNRSNLLSYASFATSIIFQIQNSVSDAQYRSKVLEGLKAMKSQLDSIQENIDQILANQEYTKVTDELDNAHVDIETYYQFDEIQNWINGKDYEVPQNIKDEITYPKVEKYLKRIHLIISDQVGPTKKTWLEAFMACTPKPPNIPTTRIEMWYRFTCYLFEVQLKGMVLMAACEMPERDSYANTLIGDFKEQAKINQEVIDKLVVSHSDLWWTKNSDTKYEKITTVHYGDTEFKMPQNHALCGFRLGMDGNRYAHLMAIHGKINQKGELEGKTSESPVYGKSFTDLGGSIADAKTDIHGYVDTNTVEVDEGHVITNIKFLEHEETFREIRGTGDFMYMILYKAVYPAVYQAPFDSKGNIDTSASTCGWKSNPSKFENEGGGPSSSHFERWNGYWGRIEVDSPLTAVQFLKVDGKCVSQHAKAALHFKSFGKIE